MQEIPNEVPGGESGPTAKCEPVCYNGAKPMGRGCPGWQKPACYNTMDCVFGNGSPAGTETGRAQKRRMKCQIQKT